MSKIFETGSVDLPEIPEYYANVVSLASSPWDFVLEFGLQGVPDAPGSEMPPAKRLVRIRMSPQHALITAKLLISKVRQFEATSGKIGLPPQLYSDLGLEPD